MSASRDNCRAKRCYDKKGARSQINRLRSGPQRRHVPTTLRCYHCSDCGWWHITKKD